MAATVSSTRRVLQPQIISAGTYGAVYKMSDLVAVKIPHRIQGCEEELAKEQNFVGLLRQRSPYLIPYIYQTSSALFMMRASCDLQFVIDSESYRYRSKVGTLWMGQLCGGAAFMERSGFAHGDLRPRNILIDQNNNLRIHDLGSVLQVGKILPVGTEPFARMPTRDDGEVRLGTYGRAGAYTENFAIGSIFYSLIRGYVPYAGENLSSETLQRMFRGKEFPQLTNSIEDEIISNCWHRRYDSVKELEQVFRDMRDGTEWYLFDAETEEWIAERREECVTWLDAGVIDSLPRISWEAPMAV